MGKIWDFWTFLGERMKGLPWIFFRLMYLGHFQNWLFYGHSLLILFWCYFDIAKWVKFGVSVHFVENSLRKWPEILHAYVFWIPAELIRLSSQFVDISNLGTILTYRNGSNFLVAVILVKLCAFSSLWCTFDWNWSYLGFRGIVRRMCGSECQGGSRGIFPMLCLQFCLVSYLTVLEKDCSDFTISMNDLHWSGGRNVILQVNYSNSVHD